MSNKLNRKIKKKNTITIELPKRYNGLKTISFVSIILCFSLFVLFSYFSTIKYHNELGKITMTCDSTTKLVVDSNGVFTWYLDESDTNNMRGVLYSYFGDNAIEYILNNKDIYDLDISTINTFFSETNKKEDFFALRIDGFYYDMGAEKLATKQPIYFYGFELDNNRLQALEPKSYNIRMFKYVE